MDVVCVIDHSQGDITLSFSAVGEMTVKETEFRRLWLVRRLFKWIQTTAQGLPVSVLFLRRVSGHMFLGGIHRGVVIVSN